jgi:putative heme-binding domain-containing protein
VQTVDGRQLSGLRLPSSANEVVLKDAENKEVRVATDQVEQLVPQTVSLMPESLFRAMTAQQLSDLVEYLSGLK